MHKAFYSRFLILPKRKKTPRKKAQELQNTLAQLEAEYNEMYNKYSSEEASMSEAVKALKQDEIRDKITRIDNFRASAQEELQTEEAKLLQPVYEKVRAAIQEVAKEQGYTYVLDAATLLYVDGGTDISEDVKKKLNMAGK